MWFLLSLWVVLLVPLPLAAAEEARFVPPPSPVAASSPEPKILEARGTRESPFIIDAVEGADQIAQRQDDRRHRLFEENRDYVLGAISGATLLVAIVQAVMFFWQLRMARDAIRDAEHAATTAARSAEATHQAAIAHKNAARAWMRPDEIHGSDSQGRWSFGFKWTNVGVTPGINGATQAGLILLKNGDPVPDSYIDSLEWLPAAVVFPGQFFEAPPIKLDERSLEIALARQGELKLFGRMRYIDTVNGGEHVTTVCRIVRPLRRPDGALRFEYDHILEHNTAD
ncbi:hypothetical protein [Mitsuaria sp. GD03876]|uniref:hypothetical protein n=1 Tax=Mitsuaria sp. GD03876 TaxID=2975399 RepID=UPI0024487D02|nr:hypothetical protein [Mitsuaria sp. GD03876]MDH0866459.1 hypothetical protein [Mitsuaria sp. GD03876]